MKYFAQLGDRNYECILEAANGTLKVHIGGKVYLADLRHLADSHTYSLLLDGRSYEFAIHETEEGTELSGGAGLFHVQVEDARTHAARQATVGARESGGPRALKAAMPGIVREVLIEAGAKVEKGQPLLILEAMKMQNEIGAPAAGVIKTLHVREKQAVGTGDKLATLAAE